MSQLPSSQCRRNSTAGKNAYYYRGAAAVALCLVFLAHQHGQWRHRSQSCPRNDECSQIFNICATGSGGSSMSTVYVGVAHPASLCTRQRRFCRTLRVFCLRIVYFFSLMCATFLSCVAIQDQHIVGRVGHHRAAGIRHCQVLSALWDSARSRLKAYLTPYVSSVRCCGSPG